MTPVAKVRRALKRPAAWCCAFAVALAVLAPSPAAPAACATAASSSPAPPVYPTISMYHRFVDQDDADGVIYFNACQRESVRVTIKDGHVYNHTGAMIHRTRSRHHNQVNYVMDSAGNFYLVNEFKQPTIRHSSVFAGGPVAGAGNIRIARGTVVFVDDDSGHYPAQKVFANVLIELGARGVDTLSAAG
jgi:hypothetical protein